MVCGLGFTACGILLCAKRQALNSLVGNLLDPYLVVGGKLQRSNGSSFRRPYISVRELALAGTVVLIIWRPPGLLGRTGMNNPRTAHVAPPPTSSKLLP
jgi:hypothetical protein